MKIIIATENKAKVQATTTIFKQVFTGVEVISEKFSSGISEQPLSEEEGIQGATNRAQHARAKYPEADYCVGLEGFVDTNIYGMFLAGTVAIVNQVGEVGLGTSAKMQLPNSLRAQLEAGAELGPLMQTLMNDPQNNIRHHEGTGGILTKGLYNRIEEFEDATKCALARFLSPELY